MTTSGDNQVISADYSFTDDGRWAATVSTASDLFGCYLVITKDDILDVMFAVLDVRVLAEHYVGASVDVVHTVDGSVDRWNEIMSL